MKKYIAILLLILSVNSFGQNKRHKWGLSLGGSFFLTDDRVAFPDDGFNVQVPNLAITRYINNGFSVVGKLSFTGIQGIPGAFTNDHQIALLDLHGKYDFKLTENKWVPYVVGGLGYNVKDQDFNAGSLNIGAGMTFWLFPRIGLNGEIVRRMVSSKNPTHFSSITQFSGSLIYTFGQSCRRARWRGGRGFTN